MRLFIATRVADETARRIHAAFAPVRAGAGRASWVQKHAYHLTYAFIGERSEADAARIAAALPPAVARLNRYEGALSGGGFFPNERRPRVGWLAFESAETLAAIADAVRQSLDGIGIEHDRKAFRAHLTLVRIRDGWSQRDVGEFRRAAEALGRLEVVIDSVALYRSELRPEGARHEEIVAASLA